MPATPPPAAPAPESATTALYRAALGPVNAEHHLPVFDRFDAAGHASPAWNSAAGFITLNWMLFRQLWGAALVYVVCIGGLLLLLLGPLREALQWPLWPQGVQWGALGVLLLLSVVIPGMFGQAILHADVRRRILRAVRRAKTVREACEALAQQASTRRRFWGLAGLNGLLAMAAVTTIQWGAPGATTPAMVAEAMVASAQPPGVAEASDALEVAMAQPFETAPAGYTAARADAVPAPETEAAPGEPPSVADAVVVPVVAAQEEAAAPAQPAPMILAPKVEPRPPMQVHGINVGLFAERINAEKAHARLLEAGLPAILQTTESAKGTPLTRVRVGPLASREQAEQAAERIRAMGLEARIFAPGGG